MSRKKKQLTREQALDQLKRTRILSTDLLAPLGISFEAWLRWSQLPDDRAAEIVETYIKQVEWGMR